MASRSSSGGKGTKSSLPAGPAGKPVKQRASGLRTQPRLKPLARPDAGATAADARSAGKSSDATSAESKAAAPKARPRIAGPGDPTERELPTDLAAGAAADTSVDVDADTDPPSSTAGGGSASRRAKAEPRAAKAARDTGDAPARAAKAASADADAPARARRTAADKPAARSRESAPARRSAAPAPRTSPVRKRSAKPVLAALAIGVVAAGIGVALSLRRGADKRATAAKPAAPAAKPETPALPATLPPPPSPTAPRTQSAYVGSAKCGECHAQELTGWKHSWHAKALAPGAPANVAGNFAHAHFAGGSSEATMTRAGAKSVMTTRGPDGTVADFAVDWVIGGKRMQDSVHVFPDGRWQVLPVYFHVTTREWVDYTEAKQGALTPEHPFYWTNARRMANHECLDCHTTGLAVSFDESKQQWSTTFADGSVACEDCHGAGGHHADTQEASDIVHPARAAAAGMAACARCHGPRNPLYPLLDTEHAFRVGVDSYDELYDPIVVGAASDFFADGRPSTSSFEYQALLQSACYRKGGATTCLACHTAPHDAKRPSELRADPDATCRDCHAPIVKQGAAHTHHKSAAGQSCIGCHMPKVVSGVLDHFSDHAIDIPNPANTIAHDIPSACGACHADKDADTLQGKTLEWWPDAAAKQARRTRLADAFDEKTAKHSGDALRAVIADAEEAPTLRGAAMLAIARRFGPQSARAIAPLLDDKSVLLRAKALEALALAHATSSADDVAKHLADPSVRVQLAAALALYDLHDARGEQALATLSTAEATSHLMVPHLELGNAAVRRHDVKRARAELTWVARLAPYYVDGLVTLANLCAEDGDLAEAKARVAQALALEPHHRQALALQAHLPR